MSRGEVIFITSGKGGAGKTTASVNLATILSKNQNNVLLMEGDLTNPNLGFHLGKEDFPSCLMKVLNEGARLEDSIFIHPIGFKILPVSLSFQNIKEIDVEKLDVIFIRLKQMFDYIIIDSAAGVGEEVELFLKYLDKSLVVTNPEIPALSDSYKITQKLKKNYIDVIGTILNKVSNAYDVTHTAIEGFLELPILAKIPEHKHIKKSIHNKVPLAHSKPKHKISKEFEKVVRFIDPNFLSKKINNLRKRNQFLREMLKV